MSWERAEINGLVLLFEDSSPDLSNFSTSTFSYKSRLKCSCPLTNDDGSRRDSNPRGLTQDTFYWPQMLTNANCKDKSFPKMSWGRERKRWMNWTNTSRFQTLSSSSLFSAVEEDDEKTLIKNLVFTSAAGAFEPTFLFSIRLMNYGARYFQDSHNRFWNINNETMAIIIVTKLLSSEGGIAGKNMSLL